MTKEALKGRRGIVVRRGCLSLLPAFLSLAVLNCATTRSAHLDNTPGRPTTYLSPGDASPSGLGIESNEIESSTDLMVRDMLTVAQLANSPTRSPVNMRW